MITNVVTVRAFARDCSRIVCCSDLPAGDDEVVLVKHFSVILDFGNKESAQSKEYMSDGSANPGKRLAFLADVGRTALNLVDLIGLCHNDIRPPNIAVLGNRCCLIDYDKTAARCRRRFSTNRS